MDGDDGTYSGDFKIKHVGPISGLKPPGYLNLSF